MEYFRGVDEPFPAARHDDDVVPREVEVVLDEAAERRGPGRSHRRQLIPGRQVRRGRVEVENGRVGVLGIAFVALSWKK